MEGPYADFMGASMLAVDPGNDDSNPAAPPAAHAAPAPPAAKAAPRLAQTSSVPRPSGPRRNLEKNPRHIL